MESLALAVLCPSMSSPQLIGSRRGSRTGRGSLGQALSAKLHTGEGSPGKLVSSVWVLSCTDICPPKVLCCQASMLCRRCTAIGTWSPTRLGTSMRNGGLYCSSSVLAATELVVLVVLGPLLVRARLQDGLQVARAIFAWFVSGLVLRKASPLISS